MQQSGLLNRISSTSMSYFDPDITFEMAKSTEVCPFEVSLELIEQADVIVCDYNYIFDPYVGLKAYQQENDYGDCVLDRRRGAQPRRPRPRLLLAGAAREAVRRASATICAARNCWIDGCGGAAGACCAITSASWRAVDRRRRGRRRTEAGRSASRRELFIEQRTEWERIVIEYIGWKIENRIVEEDDPVIDFYFKLVKFTNLHDGGRRTSSRT